MKNLEYRKIAQSVNLGEILISSDVKLSDNFNDGFIFSSKAKEIGISISKDNGENVQDAGNKLDLLIKVMIYAIVAFW